MVYKIKKKNRKHNNSMNRLSLTVQKTSLFTLLSLKVSRLSSRKIKSYLKASRKETLND